MLADQWMPEMGGDDLLGRVRFIDPLARRVMLVNWGDSSSPETIYHSCAYGLIEFFMNKPWHSGTDERFHHEISDQLYQWSRANQPVFEAVKIVAERWSARAHELRDVLKRNGVPYGFYPVDSSEGEEVLADNGLDRAVSLPVAVVFGGKVLEDPYEPRAGRGHRSEEPARGRWMRPCRRRRRPGRPGRSRLRLL